jgi:TPR repeat protein
MLQPSGAPTVYSMVTRFRLRRRLAMTPTWRDPRHDAEPSTGKLALVNLGIAAVAIVAAMIAFLVHAWRLPETPATPRAQLEHAEKTFLAGNNRAALTAFTKLAGEDNPAAQYWLGHMTELGLGVARDPKAALELYKKAAARGVAAAESRLGEAYLRGDMMPPDFAQAKTWLERAARSGNARAAMLLGHMYRIGLAVPADAKEAYAWSEVATIEGSPFAQRERDLSLSAMSAGDQQAAAARANEILADIRHETAAKPAR